MEPTTPINGNKKVEFLYDYMGRRVQKKVYTYSTDSWLLTSDSLFFYNDWNMIQEMNGTGVVQKTYIYGLDLSQSTEGAGGVGGLLSSIQDKESSSQLFLYDANGNVGQFLKASDGNILAHYEYDPFGILLKSSGIIANENPFRFSTKYYDVETGLYYYGYRFYNPNLGRWISRDQKEEEGGLNLYGFVGNDPISRIDMYGLWSSNVHYLYTRNWARALGYPGDMAETIGKEDEGVDKGRTSFMPIIGDQRYHFDRNRGRGKDTRIELYEKHLLKAKNLCTWNQRIKFDNPQQAAKELGIALHPYQDWVAHGDYGFYDEGGVYTIHNQYSPQKTWGNPIDYPDDITLDAANGPDGRPSDGAMHAIVTKNGISIRLYAIYKPGNRRIYLTKKITETTLKEYLAYVNKNGNCKCKQFFGLLK